jgi:hypothetical protein
MVIFFTSFRIVCYQINEKNLVCWVHYMEAIHIPDPGIHLMYLTQYILYFYLLKEAATASETLCFFNPKKITGNIHYMCESNTRTSS